MAQRRVVRRVPVLLLALLTTASFGPSGSVFAADPHDPDHAHETDAVVVTGSPLELSSDELAISTQTLDRDQVLTHLKPTIGDLLGREPGITNTGFAAGASRPVLRGQDALRVRVLENGIGIHDVSTLSPDHGVPLNPLTTRRVEVIRGPSTLRYGGGAIGGVVNALTNRVPRVLPTRALQGEFFSGYGVGSRERNGAFVLEGGLGQFAYHLDGMRQRAGDLPSPDGVRGTDIQNSFVDPYALSAGGAWIGEQGRVGVAFSRFATEYGIPEETAFIQAQQNNWAFEGDWNPGTSLIEVVRIRGNSTTYQHDEVAQGEGTAATFDNDQVEVRAEVVHAPIGGLRGAVGVQYGDRDFEARGEASEFLSPTDTDMIAVYLWEDVELGERTRLQFGARAENNRVDGTTAANQKRSRTFHPLSVSAGLLFELTQDLSAAFNVSAMQRAPDAVELFARGPHEATETFERGDVNLDEEKSLAGEFTLRADSETASGEVSVFYTSYDDYVFGQLTGRTCTEAGACIVGPGNELNELSYVQRDAVFYGGEARGQAEVFPLLDGHVGVDAQVDVVRGRLSSGNVPRQPPMRYGGGVHFENERVRARIGFLRNRKQRRQAQFETETGGFTSVDASLIVRLVERGDQSLDFIATANNLFDERGRNHVNFRKDEVPNPGRVIRVGVHGRF